jgi:SpoIID/LytB domain protein
MPSPSSRLRCLLAALVLVGTGVAAVATAQVSAAYPTANVRFEGHGWGHGRGLGQYGSLGYAIDEQQSYSTILDHYYSNTTKGTKADGVISVKLIFLDGTTDAPTDMTVTSGGGFTIGDRSFNAGELARVHWNGDGWTIERAAACGGPWTDASSVAAGQRPEAKTAYAGEDFTQMLTVLEPAADKPCTEWNRRTYRGSLQIAVLDSVFTRVLNWVSMEQYLRGVVPRESPASWGDLGTNKSGMNALKAQAVAARSYAWAENRHAEYKTCDTTQCQVYGGAALNGVRSEDVRSDTAVSQTAGEVRMLSGAVARTEFSSSTGGWTAGGTFPAVEDTGDDVASNPFHNWSVDVPVTTVEAAFPDIGTLQAISVTKRNALGADGGRVLSVKVVGSSSSVTVTGNELRSKLSLRSDWFSVIDVPVDVLRVAGSDRIATSVAIAKDVFGDDEADAAVLASSANYPDALVGAPLATKGNGPILLTDPLALSAATKAELDRVLADGNTVYLLGGTGALSKQVEDQVVAEGYDVIRYGGVNRFDTAVKVAEALGNPTTVLEATGALFPDALAAGAAASKVDGSVLLTDGSKQAAETAAYLQAHPPAVRYAIGGGAATADPIATKVVGADRYATAVAVAKLFFESAEAAGLASGETYFDALGGGVHAAMHDGPLLLTQTKTLPTSTSGYFRDTAGVLSAVYAYGGTAAISDAVLTDLRTS